jgi:hypothetical protein
MKVIANKTKLETASMHVITVVTLIFLPATFVAVRTSPSSLICNNSPPTPMKKSN